MAAPIVKTVVPPGLVRVPAVPALGAMGLDDSPGESMGLDAALPNASTAMQLGSARA